MVETLLKIQNKKISAKKGYKMLYRKGYKKTNFIKIKIKLSNNKPFTYLLKVITILPTPVFIAKRAFSNKLNELNLNVKDIPRGIKLKVNTSEFSIQLKTL